MEKPVTTSSNTCGEGASGSASAPESTPPMVKLKRFIYLNNNQCAFVKLKPIDLNNISEQLNCILEMGDELPVTIIKKVRIKILHLLYRTVKCFTSMCIVICHT